MMILRAGGAEFRVDTEDNPTAEALLRRLPLRVRLVELNGNEKYCDIGDPLPSRPERVGRIREGDVMLYGDDCLVFFYRDFGTPYSYTRVGRVEDPRGLEHADGEGVLEDGGRSDGRTRRRDRRASRTPDTGSRHPPAPCRRPIPRGR